jgi:general secretion pathway protein J
MTKRSDAGLTLLELTAVLAIFSLVAVLSVESLTGAMNSRGRIVAAGERTAALATTLTLLRRDLGAMVPMAVKEADGVWTQSYVVGERELSMSVAGQPELPDGRRDGVALITWGVDPVQGRLTRTRQSLGVQEAEAVPMLDGVSDWSVRTLGDEGGWTTGRWSDPRSARALPSAVEVRLRVDEIGDLRILVVR